jgi:hypothetical protein
LPHDGVPAIDSINGGNSVEALGSERWQCGHANSLHTDPLRSIALACTLKLVGKNRIDSLSPNRESPTKSGCVATHFTSSGEK